MKKMLITNNAMVEGHYRQKLDIIYLKDHTYMDILFLVRDNIHQGHRLLTHPLSGSVKPNETPYKSIIITKEKGTLDMESLQMVEGCIDVAQKLIHTKKTPKWTEKILEDFRLIDYFLIKGAIESMNQF